MTRCAPSNVACTLLDLRLSPVQRTTSRAPGLAVAARAVEDKHEAASSRRQAMQATCAGLAALVISRQGVAEAASPPPAPPAKMICDSECQSKLESIQEVKTASGLRYKDIVVGKGPNPPTGYQIVADYVAMTPDGRVFDSSLDKGRPYDLRIGVGQIVAGLDEGVASMKPGGIRRIYVPGNLSFPKGVASSPGRPRVPPSSPVMFDVQLVYIPGLDDIEE